ncbi:hypothetical protein [Litorihabitans aurantiacus]|uniref:Uncharacterized protein n=1 Tax=Litorihabitans aurantiacus TaxID=1930061 RepID=A0AA37XHM2_9MICO|nr:hypothetical protein [Litorihabitans aurantiacus]GMA33408.1 hypothetical protein GCM10025875_34000 [Litorihabitans aurantiacus]
MTGLRWNDVEPDTTPALWGFAQDASIGNLVVRSVRSSTCPVDGWLSLSSGARAADQVLEDRTTDASGLLCRPLLEASEPAQVPGWADYVEAASASSFGTRLGLWGEELRLAGAGATAIGPGAALALALPDGSLDTGTTTVLPRPADPADLAAAVGDAVGTRDVVVVDAGEIRDWNTRVPDPSESEAAAEAAQAAAETQAAEAGEADGAAAAAAAQEEPAAVEPPDPALYRAQQVAQIEANVAAVLDGVASATTPSGEPTVVIASIADAGRAPSMQVLAASGPAFTPQGEAFGPGTLTTSSTRQLGYVQSTDLLPGFLDRSGITTPASPGAQAALVGSPPRTVPGAASAEAADERIASLVDDERHAQAMRPIVAPFYLLVVVLNVALYAGVALGLTRPAATRTGAAVARWLKLEGKGVPLSQVRPHVLRALRVVAVAMASIPVSTYLANLVPWWRAGSPSLGLAGATLAIVALVTVVALAKPWRHQILTPLGIVAGLTAAVLLGDIATGATLQLSAVMGVPVLVAGRFYGFNNTAFALFATACVLLAVAITNPLVKRGRRWLSAGIIAVIGIVAAYVDGAPSIGADFGGPPAIVPAFALLALMAAGIRITWLRVVGVLGGAVVATLAFAAIDYLRPPSERSHLGRFIETLLDGGAWEVVLRKLEANLRILANNRPLTILAITGVALVVFVLARPLKTAITSPGGGRFSWLSSGAPISQMGTVAPMLRPGLVALAVVLGIGFAVNDSGIAIPAYGVAVAVPLLLAACASWMLSLPPGAARRWSRSRWRPGRKRRGRRRRRPRRSRASYARSPG